MSLLSDSLYRLRLERAHSTIRAEGCLPSKTALTMDFGLVEGAQQCRRRLDGHAELPDLILDLTVSGGLQVAAMPRAPRTEPSPPCQPGHHPHLAIAASGEVSADGAPEAPEATERSLRPDPAILRATPPGSEHVPRKQMQSNPARQPVRAFRKEGHCPRPHRQPVASPTLTMSPPPPYKRPFPKGAVAQMGERCNRTAEVRSSILLGSTNKIKDLEHPACSSIHSSKRLANSYFAAGQ